jgi:hypothetical protein
MLARRRFQRELGRLCCSAGNDAIAAGRYYEALELYTQAISIVDSIAIYYANRWVCVTVARAPGILSANFPDLSGNTR